MPSLLDVLKAQKAEREPLVVSREEWERFIETGYCPWEFVEPHVYRHAETGELLDDRLRQIVFPGRG